MSFYDDNRNEYRIIDEIDKVTEEYRESEAESGVKELIGFVKVQPPLPRVSDRVSQIRVITESRSKDLLTNVPPDYWTHLKNLQPLRIRFISPQVEHAAVKILSALPEVFYQYRESGLLGGDGGAAIGMIPKILEELDPAERYSILKDMQECMDSGPEQDTDFDQVTFSTTKHLKMKYQFLLRGSDVGFQFLYAVRSFHKGRLQRKRLDKRAYVRRSRGGI